MANIVDALLVTLGLDTKEYQKGTKKAEKALDEFSKKQDDAKKKNADSDKKAEREKNKQFSEQRRQDKESLQALNKMRNEMLGIMGLFMAGQGIMAFAKNSIFGAAAVGRLGDNAKMSVEEVAGLGQALERIGGTTQEAQSQIESITEAIAKYKLGMDSAITEYQRWGGSVQGHQLDNAKETLLGMADLFETLSKKDVSKALFQAHQMGISTNMFNLLKQGRAAVQAQIADGARLTGINRKQTDEAARAQKAWVDMAAHLESVGRAVLFPILQAISDWMGKHKADIHVWIDKLRNAINEFSPKAIEGIGATFDKIYETVKAIVHGLEMMSSLADKFGFGSTGKTPSGASPKMMVGGPIAGGGAYAQTLMSMVSAMSGWAFGKSSSSSTSSVQIGQINVHGANDPKGSAAAVSSALQNFSGLAAQANGPRR